MNHMKIKLVTLIVVISIGLCSSTLFSVSMASNEKTIYTMTMEDQESIVGEIPDKILLFDDVIGDIHVQYWQHHIEEVVVKNDAIIIHTDPLTREVLYSQNTWSEIEKEIIPSENHEWVMDDVWYQQQVIFVDEEDTNGFYTVDESVTYPLVCWEVRHRDGTTILYDAPGHIIGSGVPAPSKGFSLSGFNENSWPDPWVEYRQNADIWFSKWCNPSVSRSLPSPSQISAFVSDPEMMFFYELAHGDQYSFQADSIGSSYYADGQTAYTVEKDVQNREPFTFAFIGSCHGLTSVEEGTFSYEFRKGEIVETVTVGFDHMESCPGWEYGYYWQDLMFDYMDQGYTIKESFDLATAYYPTIEPAVVFIGDETLTVYDAFGDLTCHDDITWNQVKPNTEVTGTIQLVNSGNQHSKLDWEIVSYPTWGDWTFSPDHGTDITPEDGEQTIQVTILTPSGSNSEFSGEIKVANANNQNDVATIAVQLSTAKHNMIPLVIYQIFKDCFSRFHYLQYWI